MQRLSHHPSLWSPRWRAAWRWLLVLLLGIVSWLAFRPSDGLPSFEHLDKLQHLAAFAVLAGVALLAVAPLRHAERLVALGLLAYGLLIEFVQTRLPTRSGSALDLLADALGIAAGLLLMHRLRNRA